jgi:heat shock protein HtpX
MNLLTERELRGVIGHELSHVYNRDILTASVAATMASVMMSMVQFFWLFGGRDSQRSNPIGAIFLMIVGPMAATMLQLAIGRSREFAADEDGAIFNTSSNSRTCKKIRNDGTTDGAVFIKP